MPAFSTTLTSLAVPAKVKVPPKFTGDVLLPSETVIELFDNDELPMFDNVLSAPLIVLFVNVSVFALSEPVPAASGNVIVLSAVGSATVKVVSCASAVEP